MMLQRTLVWVGVMALVIFVFVMHKSVSTLKTTVQGHTVALNKPMITAEVFPGVPAAFAERWSTATQGTDLTSQDHLWLTLYLANSGQSQARGIAANLLLLPAISAIYPDSGALVGDPVVAAEGTGQTRAMFSFLSLAPGNAHTVFIALRPDDLTGDLTGPPYEAPAQHQWVAQHRAYWVQFTVTAQEHTTFVQYGFASSLSDRQAASSPAGAHASPGAQRRAALSAP
jgi:hypothetical protein